MKPTIFVLLLLVVLVPRASYAGPIRGADNSDYGMQLPTDCAGLVSNSTSFSPKCFLAPFLGSAGTPWGLLLSFDEPVNDIAVTFSNLNIFNAPLSYGLEECHSKNDDGSDNTGDFNCIDRGSTPGLDLSAYDDPSTPLINESLSILDLFTQSDPAPALGIPGQSITFRLTGALGKGPFVPESSYSPFKNQVAFLVLCTPTDTDPFSGRPVGVKSDCDGASISVTSPVPEPGSLFLCGSGALMLARRIRNRRRL